MGVVHCGYFHLVEKLKNPHPRPEEDPGALFTRAKLFLLSGLSFRGFFACLFLFYISLNSQVIHFLLRQTHSQV